MKKRMLSILLSLCLVVSLLPTMAFALEDASISSTKPTAKAGETFDVTLTIPSNSEKKAYSASFKFKYESSAFEVESFTAPTIGSTTANGFNAASGAVSCTYEGVMGENTLDFSSGLTITATFKVKDTAAPGTYYFTVDNEHTFAYELDETDYTTEYSLFNVPSKLEVAVKVPAIPVTSASFTMTGYAVGSKIADLAVTADTATSAVLQYTNTYWDDYVICTDAAALEGDFDSYVDSSTDTFEAGKNYYLPVILFAAEGYDLTGLTKDDVELGEKSADALIVNGSYTFAVFKLDALTAPTPPTPTLTPVTSASFTMSGYEVGSKIVDLAVSGTNTGLVTIDAADYGYSYVISTSADALTGSLDSKVTDDSATFAAGTDYYLMIGLDAQDGYSLTGLTKDAIKLGTKSADALVTAEGIPAAIFKLDALTAPAPPTPTLTPVTSASFTMSGYEVGSKIADLVISGTNTGLVTIDAADYGYSYVISTSADALTGSLDSKVTDDSATFAAGTDYYLMIGLDAQDGYSLTGLTKDNVKLGTKSADALITAAGIPSAVFKLDALTAPTPPTPTTYTVTVNGSTASDNGAGEYAEGETVTIKAGGKDGFVFKNWTASDGVTLANPTNTTTTFTMPAKPVTVTVNWLESVTSASFTMSGYEVGSKIADLVISGTNTGIKPLDGYGTSYVIYKDAALTDAVLVSSDETFAAGTDYWLFIATLEDDGYAVNNLDVSNCKLNGTAAIDRSTDYFVFKLAVLSDPTPSTHTHSYTAETVKDAALKSAATCTSKAVYYKSCATCGTVSTNAADTFESGDLAAHSYTAETVKDAALKSAATCTSKAVYYKSCAMCGTVSTNAADTFESGDLAAHSYTAETVKDAALKSAATCTSKAVYYKSCATCGTVSTNAADTFESGDLAAHVYDDDADTDCNICGYVRTVTPSTPSKPSSSGKTSYAITVKAAKNGDVTVDRKSAGSGTTVTVTVAPDKGYTLETLTVLDKNGKEVKLTAKNGKYTFTMPTGKVSVEATFMDDNTMLNFFTDVPMDAYYYDAVLWAVENGITNGTSETTFSPDMACTRAQIVTFLWRAAGSPEPKAMSSFEDVPADAYYAKAVAWAVENNITSGVGDGKFAPDATCTRAQCVTFLYRAAGSPAVSDGAVFSDVNTASYYADAVSWAAQQSITDGIGGGLFGSDNDCTRAQIVTFLYRSVAK